MIDINKIVKDFLNGFFSQEKLEKKKRKYTKRVYKEKDCEVSYDPTWLYKMNLPYAEYVDFVEIH